MLHYASVFPALSTGEIIGLVLFTAPLGIVIVWVTLADFFQYRAYEKRKVIVHDFLVELYGEDTFEPIEMYEAKNIARNEGNEEAYEAINERLRYTLLNKIERERMEKTNVVIIRNSIF